MSAEQTTRSSGNENSERTVTVDVELTEPMIAILSELKHDDQSISEWIVKAIDMRVALAGERHCYHDLAVYVPDDVAEWAELRAEDARIRGREVDVDDYVYEHLDINLEYKADEEALGEFTAEQST